MSNFVFSLKEMVDLLMLASQCKDKRCHYPNCSKGKELLHHLFITCTKERGEYKEHQERRRIKKENRLRRNEPRLIMLRKREDCLRKSYDRQMYESLRASVAAVLRLSAKGEESKQNDVKKLLGSILYVFRLWNWASLNYDPSKKKGEEVK